MRVSRSTDVTEEPFEAPTFSGSVRRRDHGRTDGPDATIFLVRFEAGARTHWHRHPGGQVLYITEGRGRVATRDRVERVEAGDVVTAAPGEEHWHGAGEDAGVQHFALSFGATEWLEPVEG